MNAPKAKPKTTATAFSIWRAIDVVGDVPVLLIMERAFLGTHRFEDFVEQTGVIRSVVSNRLKSLSEIGFLEKVATSHPNRFEYHLDAMGRGLFTTALMILRWQHRWEPGSRPYRVELFHAACNKSVEPRPCCARCGALIDARRVSWSAGPGGLRMAPTYSRRRMQTSAGSANRQGAMLLDSVIELFGDRWTTLIVRACFMGLHRFGDIQQDTFIATNILSNRIDRLLEQDILKARAYSDAPPRYEYHLTEKGRDLYPVILALLEWGDRWFADKNGPPLRLRHQDCGRALKLDVVCDKCGKTLKLEETAFRLIRAPKRTAKLKPRPAPPRKRSTQ